MAGGLGWAVFVLLRLRRWFKCGFQTHRRRMQGGEALQEGFANFICLSNFASVGPTCWNALLGLLMLRLSDEPVRTCSCCRRGAVTTDVVMGGWWVVLADYFGVDCGFAGSKASQHPPLRSKRIYLWPGVLARGRRPTWWRRRWA